VTDWLPRLVARLPAGVHAKLLVAFLVIAGLLIAVGAVGLQVLSGVNRRAEDLVKFQRKIAAYRQLQHDATGQLYSVASALVRPDERTLEATLRQLNQFGYDLDPRSRLSHRTEQGAEAMNTNADRSSRRGFLRGVRFAGVTGFLGLRGEPVAAEPPPGDDRIRIHDAPITCFAPVHVAPGHCTGEPTFSALKKAFGDRYLCAGLGTTFALRAMPRAVAGGGSAHARRHG
jgi:hypothetical protein